MRRLTRLASCQLNEQTPIMEETPYHGRNACILDVLRVGGETPADGAFSLFPAPALPYGRPTQAQRIGSLTLCRIGTAR